MCCLPQVTLDCRLRNWSHHYLYQVDYGDDYMVMIVIMLIMEIEMIMTMMTVMRNTSGNDCSHYQNTLCCVGNSSAISHFTGSRFEAPNSPTRLTSLLDQVKNDDYERMVNDDECPVYLCVRVCFCLFHSKLLSHTEAM